MFVCVFFSHTCLSTVINVVNVISEEICGILDQLFKVIYNTVHKLEIELC